MRHFSILIGGIACMTACAAPTQKISHSMIGTEKLHLAQRNQDAYMYCDRGACLQRTFKTLRVVESGADEGRANEIPSVTVPAVEAITSSNNLAGQEEVVPKQQKKLLRKKTMKAKKTRPSKPNCITKT
jgi:hypothetical protein